MTCDTYCTNNGCHGGPGCPAGQPATVAKVKASHPAPQSTDDVEIDLPLWPSVVAAIVLVLWCVGASALIAGAATPV